MAEMVDRIVERYIIYISVTDSLDGIKNPYKSYLWARAGLEREESMELSDCQSIATWYRELSIRRRMDHNLLGQGHIQPAFQVPHSL